MTSQSPMEDWLKLNQFRYPHEAFFAKAYLKNYGIDSIIRDDYIVQMHYFYSNAVGGVKLYIRESDHEKALELFRIAGYISKGKAEKRKISKVPEDDLQFRGNCPFCGSDDIFKGKEFSAWCFLYFLFMGVIVPPFYRNIYKCYECDEEFKIK